MKLQNTLSENKANDIVNEDSSGDNILTEPQSFSTSLTGANCTFSLTATQTADLAEGKYYYSLTYTQSDGTTKERLAEGLITVEASAEVTNG